MPGAQPLCSSVLINLATGKRATLGAAALGLASAQDGSMRLLDRLVMQYGQQGSGAVCRSGMVLVAVRPDRVMPLERADGKATMQVVILEFRDLSAINRAMKSCRASPPKAREQ